MATTKLLSVRIVLEMFLKEHCRGGHETGTSGELLKMFTEKAFTSRMLQF